MYLISLYFDEKTNKTLQNLIDKVAKETGNTFMTENKVPPHITVSALETLDEESLVKSLDKKIENIKKGSLAWVSIGTFNSRVIFISLILNQYLHEISTLIHEGASEISDVSFSKFYLPLNWFPHTTIGKKLSEDELFTAFKVLQKHFSLFEGQVTKIGLSKTKPYKEIKFWEL